MAGLMARQINVVPESDFNISGKLLQLDPQMCYSKENRVA